MSTEKKYPSDLSDQEWAVIAELIQPSPSAGRPQTLPSRFSVTLGMVMLVGLGYIDR